MGVHFAGGPLLAKIRCAGLYPFLANTMLASD